MLTYLVGETHQGLIHATDDDVLLPPEQSHRLTVQLAQHLGSWPTTLQQAEGSDCKIVLLEAYLVSTNTYSA